LFIEKKKKQEEKKSALDNISYTIKSIITEKGRR